jgi:hypothetical protein
MLRQPSRRIFNQDIDTHIFLTLFVLASENRLTQDADRRGQLDLQINLLAEQEMIMVLRIVPTVRKGTEARSSRRRRRGGTAVNVWVAGLASGRFASAPVLGERFAQRAPSRTMTTGAWRGVRRVPGYDA